jgi:hypothetical protein
MLGQEENVGQFLIRDFEVRGLHDMEAMLERLAKGPRRVAGPHRRHQGRGVFAT